MSSRVDRTIPISGSSAWPDRSSLLRELTLDGAKAYFDTADHDHHHFVVDGENRVIDIPADEIDVASLPVPPAGYEIARVDVVVRLRKIDS